MGKDAFIEVWVEDGFVLFLLEGKEKNFNIKKGDTLGLPYDLKSIMHYGE